MKLKRYYNVCRKCNPSSFTQSNTHRCSVCEGNNIQRVVRSEFLK